MNDDFMVTGDLLLVMYRKACVYLAPSKSGIVLRFVLLSLSVIRDVL